MFIDLTKALAAQQWMRRPVISLPKARLSLSFFYSLADNSDDEQVA
jgi:hypothetical protein